MASKLTSTFYKTSSNKCPLKEWMDKLSPSTQVKIYRNMDLLEKFPENRHFKFVKKLEKDLFEIKIRAENKWPRVIYFYYGKMK